MKQKDHYRQILRLVSRIGRLTNPQHLPVVKTKRMSLTQFLVLDALSDAGAPCRMTELAHAAGLPPSELTRVVGDLERRRWVKRDTDPADSRARRVATTAAGSRLLEAVRRQATAGLHGVWSDFTHDEWHRFIDYLQRFANGLGRARATLAPPRGRKTRR